MYHQVRRVGLDDGGRAGLADDMGLVRVLVGSLFEKLKVAYTISQPSFADAIAEK
jgi:hypothetical protein